MRVQTGGAPPQGIKRYQLESGLERMTPAERAARGKEARAAVPRDSHAVFDPPPGRADPIGLLNRPGFCGGSQSTGEWDDGSSTEVSGRAA